MNEGIKDSKNAYLSFKLGNELFAVSVHKVLEVLQQQQLTEVPNTPGYILGVINFRGDIIPITNTRKKSIMMINNINNLIESNKFDYHIYLQDSHPDKHVSLASTYKSAKPFQVVDVNINNRYYKYGYYYKSKMFDHVWSILFA